MFMLNLRASIDKKTPSTNDEDMIDLFLQLNSFPAHFPINVRKHLNEAYPGQWIGI